MWCHKEGGLCLREAGVYGVLVEEAFHYLWVDTVYGVRVWCVGGGGMAFH